MKICTKCQAEYPDDMAFCPRCGTQLQPKAQEYSCPTCGKILGKIIPHFCPYCGQELASNNTSYTSSHANNKPINTTVSDNSNSDESEKSTPGSILKSVLSFIGLIFLWVLAKACGRGLVRGTTPQQKGFFIGALFAGIVSGIIPAFVAYKYCKFDNPFNAVCVIFILQIILSFLSANQIIPLGSIPIGVILAILLYLFNKK